MQSLLLKETDKEKPEEDNEMDTRPHQRQQRTTARALSLPTNRRTQMTTLPDMRREVFLPDFLLLHCTRTRDQIVDCLAVHLEPLVRSAVREELRPVFDFFKDFIRPQRLLPDRDTEARYRLHFINGVKDPTFTDDPVTDNKGAPIEVAIYDSHTRSIVPPDCFLSSAKVRMTVLNAELWKSKGGNWTTSEFNNSILKERDGKGPILTGGGLTFRLQNGRGTFGNIVFKDNSSWTKSGFCLGVVIEVEGEADHVERVLEAVSEPFRVKDRRGKASQKPDMLKLTDKVQSIKNIGKDRAALLEKNNIKIVENFLLSYYTDQHKLRRILGIKSESEKGWKNMVEHAMECDDEFQAKYNVRDSAAHPQQVSMGQQVNIIYPSMDQLCADVPVDSNANLVPPQEVLHGSYFHQEQLCISSEAMQMSGYLNVNVPSIPGLCYVGSGSSVPNPCEHDLIGSESACDDIRHTSQLQQAFGQTLARNVSVTNGTPLVVGLVSSQMMNPCENNINDQGDMSACYGQLTPICDLSSVSHMTIDSRNMLNGYPMHNMDDSGLFPPELPTDAVLSQISQLLSGFDTGPSENFTGSMSSSVSVAVGLSSPHRKAKRKALLKWIISPAVARKRARAAPPVTQTTVLAM